MEKLQEISNNKDETELMAKFKAETGKNAIWGNKMTKNYLKWKEHNYS